MSNASRAALSAVLLSPFVVFSGATVAQTTSPESQADTAIALEEVLVTAQKRTESLQDTPIALDAFSESALEREGINNVGDLANNVPALTIEPFPLPLSAMTACKSAAVTVCNAALMVITCV